MNQTNNVDHSEIDKFSKLASQWWDTDGPMKPLHQLNPLRLQFVQEHTPLPHSKLVDVGCGGGIFSESLAKAGAVVTGIDMSADALQVAQEHANEEQVTVDYQQTTAEQFAAQHTQSFDIVTCMEMLEHVPEPANVPIAMRSL